MVSKKFLDIGEKYIEELYKENRHNDYIAKAFVKDRKDFDKGLAKAIVKRWNQTLNNENLKEFNKLIDTQERKIKWN